MLAVAVQVDFPSIDVFLRYFKPVICITNMQIEKYREIIIVFFLNSNRNENMCSKRQKHLIESFHKKSEKYTYILMARNKCADITN